MDREYLLGLIIIGIAIVVMAGFLNTKQKDKKRQPNYKALFIIGALWIPIGLVIKNYIFILIGVGFMLIAILNRKHWKDNRNWVGLDNQEKRKRIFLIGTVVFFLIALVLVLYFLDL